MRTSTEFLPADSIVPAIATNGRARLTGGSSRKDSDLRRMRGFTVVELMITLAVAAILFAVAVPSFMTFLNSNRLTGAGNDVVSLLQNARMESLRRGVRVLVCPSNDGLTCSTPDATGWTGMISFADADANQTPASTEILRTQPFTTPLQLRASSNLSADNRIVFRPDGFAYEADGDLMTAMLAVCLPVTTPAQNVRDVVIGTGARIGVLRRNGGGACAAPANAPPST